MQADKNEVDMASASTCPVEPELSSPRDQIAPERIYLQDGCDDPDCMEGLAHGQYEGVTWCADQIHTNDTKYIRADLYDKAVAALKQAIDNIPLRVGRDYFNNLLGELGELK